jgi:hypothetical protein
MALLVSACGDAPFVVPTLTARPSPAPAMVSASPSVGALESPWAPEAEASLLDELAVIADAGPSRATDPVALTGALEEALGREDYIGSGDTFESGEGTRFTWTIPERYDEWWRTWTGIRTVSVDEPSRHTETVFGYASSFVHPDRWSVTLDGCGTEPPDGGRATFSWTVRLGTEVVREIPDTRCLVERVVLPDEGTYAVTLNVESENGWRDTLTANISVDDIVILSFGDSSASGEGNPDDTGLDVDWVDRRCHRSRTSGHALTAQALEESSTKSSVTFLSFACSGGKLGGGVLEPYEGIAAFGSGPIPTEFWEMENLRAQVDAAREALCRVPVEQCGPDDMREVDLVLLSIGINDLSFSDVVTICGNLDLKVWDLVSPTAAVLGEMFEGPCHEDIYIDHLLRNGLLSLDTELENIVAKMFACDLSDAEWEERLGYVPDDPPPNCFDGHQTFGEFRRRLAESNIAPTSGVFVSTYPVEPFSNENGETRRGCGIFRFINQDEAEYLTEIGHELNELIHREAVGNGFFSVPGITSEFRDHGYCAGTVGRIGPIDASPFVLGGSKSYFVALNESLVNQLGIHGTIHPNRRGHEAIRDAFLASIAARKPERRPTHRATVIVTGVRFDVPGAERIQANLETALTPFEVVRNSEEDDHALGRVVWKRALDVRDLDVTPGAWMKPVPVLEVDLSRADTELEFYVYATLRGDPNDGPVRSRRAPQPPDEFEPVMPPVDPGSGYVGFYRVQDSISQGTEGWVPRGGQAQRIRGQVDMGGNPGSMMVEFCVVIAEIRAGPDPDASPICLSDRVEASGSRAVSDGRNSPT